MAYNKVRVVVDGGVAPAAAAASADATATASATAAAAVSASDAATAVAAVVAPPDVAAHPAAEFSHKLISKMIQPVVTR